MAMRWRWAAVAAVLVGSQARGDMVTYTDSTQGAGGSLPLFDPALGTLQSTALAYSVTGTGASAQVTNTGSAGQTFTVNWDFHYAITVGSGPLQFASGDRVYEAAGFIPAGASQVFTAFLVSSSSAGGLSNVTNYVGPGTFGFGVTDGYATFVGVVPPGVQVVPSANPATTTLSVTYTYTPPLAVPEPPAALSTGLLSSLGALGWWRRRRAA